MAKQKTTKVAAVRKPAAEKPNRKKAVKKKKKKEQACPEHVCGFGPLVIPRSKKERDELLRQDVERREREDEEDEIRFFEAVKQAEIARKVSKKKEEANLWKTGFIFSPSDEVLVNYYLKNRTSDIAMNFCPIDDVDVYANHPRTLTEKFNPNGGFWYFFTKTRPNENPEVEGEWVPGEKKDISDNGVKVGVRQELEFNGEGAEKYKIAEYQLDPASSAPFFICKLSKTV